ncbi:hypothetical protein COLO4_25000 [Corchorus olitorius]|uniref:Strawberry notch AAA domain-containing protein n=1 Tax=Corchorus olitorius TaxID=93759 RepID=A0A1R3I5I6_9ROSI|nr:hypothetical protein COLO4_25000 [Corchorus olitorius]
MAQPSIPPPPLTQHQPPGTAAGPAPPGVQVRCAGCRMILTVAPGVTEFVCPTCQLPQMLPPELMTRARINNPPPNQSVPAHGIDPTKIQLPCANCKAILNVPHGLARDTYNTYQVVLGLDSLLEMELVSVKVEQLQVHALNKLPYSKLDSKSLGIMEGVVFLTYSSLIASSEKGRSRLQQLVQWCGSDFDGLVIFDEARLPDARVVYCSATGASEPRNMGYMVRLGLWGAGTCFPDFQKFLAALEKGGVGALELVAMDMKARGMYVCRTLSYKGAEFDVIEAALEAEMEAMYKKAAEFWAELRVELLSASAFHSNEKPNPSQLWRMYWSSHQRFFRHICMSAKVPATVRLAKQALKEDKCVVIGLQSTGEARTEEAVTKYGLELDDFVSGPRELLLKFVEENYPLPEKPEPLQGDESVKELQRKRHSATPGVSMKGRVRKVAKWKPASDGESDEESDS